MNENRCRLARENAGLSISQAAKLLNFIDEQELHEVEIAPTDMIFRDMGCVHRMAKLYGVSVEWMLGEVERYDYAAIRHIPGSGDLSFHDRDVLAEFAASMPRRSR